MNTDDDKRVEKSDFETGKPLVPVMAQMNNLSARLMMFQAQTNQQLAEMRSKAEVHAKAVDSRFAAFQTGGAKRAMAAVFYKLFRDLLRHVNGLDSVVDAVSRDQMAEGEAQWVKAFSIARDGFESVLEDYGCLPIPVEVGVEGFDPEKHEAVEGEPGEIPDGVDPDTIVGVRRRGWTLDGTIIQFPQVIVA